MTDLAAALAQTLTDQDAGSGPGRGLPRPGSATVMKLQRGYVRNLAQSPPQPLAQAAAPNLGDTDLPVLQVNSFPQQIELSDFRDAYSASNPTGDYLAAYRFRTLCNRVPHFARYFSFSGKNVEDLWDNLVFGATGQTPIARHMLSTAQQRFDSYKIPNMAGIPVNWRPVDAGPAKWYDLMGSASEIVIDLDGSGKPGDYQLIDGSGDLEWHIGTRSSPSSKKPVSGTAKRIRLRALKVDLIRGWMDFSLFEVGGWSIEGMSTGDYSTGRITGNDRLLPLLPTSIILGTDVQIEGDWSEGDKAIIAEGMTDDGTLSLGPFPLADGVARPKAPPSAATGEIASKNITHVVGYLSALVPYAPSL